VHAGICCDEGSRATNSEMLADAFRVLKLTDGCGLSCESASLVEKEDACSSKIDVGYIHITSYLYIGDELHGPCRGPPE
jgi:hypothetical protein